MTSSGFRSRFHQLPLRELSQEELDSLLNIARSDPEFADEFEQVQKLERMLSSELSATVPSGLSDHVMSTIGEHSLRQPVTVPTGKAETSAVMLMVLSVITTGGGLYLGGGLFNLFGKFMMGWGGWFETLANAITTPDAMLPLTVTATGVLLAVLALFLGESRPRDVGNHLLNQPNVSM